MEEGINEKSSLTKWDLIKSFLCWHSFSQSCHNYERMQALGFTHAMIPILTKLYTKKEDIAAGLKRHLQFFNTEPNIGSVVPGIMAALEEQKAQGVEISDETINSLKAGLMGPLAGVGDTVTQGLVKTILLAISVDIAAQGSVLGPLFFFICFTAYTLGIGYFMYMQGYRLGKEALTKILDGTLVNRITEGLTVLGLIVLGALAATRIPVSTGLTFTLGETVVKLQEIFNGIMPGLLSLITLLVVWHLLQKGKSVLWILCVMFITGFVGAYLKILV
jgi:mannose/fructose/N-acetylgalactosamine-specific phosphotransferase system component IID